MRKAINGFVISFLIVSITCFGFLGFVFKKELIDSILNYYIIVVSFVSMLFLFYRNFSNIIVDRKFKMLLLVIIFLCLWLIFTMLFGIKLGIESIKGFVNLFLIFSLSFVISIINLSSEDKKVVRYSIIYSSLFVIALGIYQYFSGYNLNVFSNYLYPGIRGRINSTFYIATLLDKYFCIVSVYLVYYLLRENENYIYKVLYLLLGVGVSLTFSRSGEFIFLLISFIFFIFSLIKKQLMNFITVVLTVVVMIFIPGNSTVLQSGANYIYNKLHIPQNFRLNIGSINNICIKCSADNENIRDDVEGSYVYNLDNFNEPSIDELNILIVEDSDVKLTVGDIAFNDIVNSEYVQYNSGELKIENSYGEGNIVVDEDNTDSSQQFRNFYKSIGIDLIKTYPIFGIGVGNYSYLYNNQNFSLYMSDPSILEFSSVYMYPHSGFVHLIAEIGIIGFIIIILFLVILIFNNFNNKFKFIFLLLFLLVILLSCYTESMFNSKQILYVFMIIYSVFLNNSDFKEE